MNDIIDDEASRAGKSEGMSRVIEHAGSFSDEFHTYILHMPVGMVFQTEEIREIWRGTPAKPQAWGACVNTEMRRGLLIQLDEEDNMKAARSHSRKTHLLMRVDPRATLLAQLATPRTRGPLDLVAAAIAEVEEEAAL